MKRKNHPLRPIHFKVNTTILLFFILKIKCFSKNNLKKIFSLKIEHNLIYSVSYYTNK